MGCAPSEDSDQPGFVVRRFKALIILTLADAGVASGGVVDARVVDKGVEEADSDVIGHMSQSQLEYS